MGSLALLIISFNRGIIRSITSSKLFFFQFVQSCIKFLRDIKNNDNKKNTLMILNNINNNNFKKRTNFKSASLFICRGVGFLF